MTSEAHALREAQYRLDLWARVQRAELSTVDYPSETPYLREYSHNWRETHLDTTTEDELEASRVGWCLQCMVGPYSAEKNTLVEAHMKGGRRGRGYQRALGIFCRMWADWCPIWEGVQQAQ